MKGIVGPGIGYSALTIGSGARPLVAITTDFSNPYTIIEDRTAMEIYKKMAGPDLDYGAENPFDPTSACDIKIFQCWIWTRKSQR